MVVFCLVCRVTFSAFKEFNILKCTRNKKRSKENLQTQSCKFLFLIRKKIKLQTFDTVLIILSRYCRVIELETLNEDDILNQHFWNSVKK